MKRRSLLLLCFLFAANTQSASARCNEPKLAALVPEFHATGSSRLNALLRFGEANHLCFGVEYVNAHLLHDTADIRVSQGTVEQAIASILGNDRTLSIVSSGAIIEIRRIASRSDSKNIFDFLLAEFGARRGSLQELSNLLSMQLVLDLKYPEVVGFAGSYPPGDLSDQIGPFREQHRSLRYLLNAMLAESKGGAWISRIAWHTRGNFKLAEQGPVWTFVQYQNSKIGYAQILDDIAMHLEPEPDSVELR